ncbi:MAG TPA: YciI family protein [Ktedonobacterales bacterium]|nr:YciI family protein [Ktedonobacterales bacterium]
MKKYVLFYESAADVRTKAPLHFAAHRARWHEFQSRGVLLLIGPFANPEEGAMGVFTTREAAEEFARDDPFVLGGVVRSWSIREWNEAIGDP